MAENEDGTGELSGTVMEEALTEGQQSQGLKRNPGGVFSIEDIRYRFDLTDHTCEEANFICAKFNKGPNPEVQKDYLTFHFTAKPTKDVLAGCVENAFARRAYCSDRKLHRRTCKQHRWGHWRTCKQYRKHSFDHRREGGSCVSA